MSRRTPPPRPLRRTAPKVRKATAARQSGRASGSSAATRSSRKPAAQHAPRRGARQGSTASVRPGSTASRRSTGARGPSARSGRSTRRQPGRARRELTLNDPKSKSKNRSSASLRRHRAQQRQSIQRRVVAPRRAAVQHTRFSAGQPRRRLIALLIALTLILVAVLVKVAQLQTASGEEFRVEGTRQWTQTTRIPADRGAIFDRNGQELALSIPAASISINPKLIDDPLATAQVLDGMLDLSDEKVASLLQAMNAKDRGFVYVQRQVDAGIGERIRQLNLTGVNVQDEDRRVLPGGDTGRSVIGRTDIDSIGTAGLEKQYEDLLVGAPGELTREVAPQGRSIAGSEAVGREPVPGSDIVLTLDRSIQHATEAALLQRVGELGARSGTVIVLDTDTGDVYAMASVRRTDDGPIEITSSNDAAVNAYEPGSVAKVITIAAGLNEEAVTPDSTFVVPWRKQYADDLLKDSHQHPDELMTVEQILVESSNIGTIFVQQSLDEDWPTARETHWNYMKQFGLGERTALDFPGESTGILKGWADLWGSERVTVAYGQGLSSTSIQLATAVNVIANDGTYVAPRLVDATVDAGGEVTKKPPSTTHEVLSPDVASEMQRMMRRVVCDGTAKRAQQGIEGFSIAGKTGTGLKAQPNGGYTNEAGEFVYYASFVGFFPAEDPQVTVLVSIDEPPAGDINRFGGTAAAPVFADLAPTIVHELGIQPPVGTTPCANS